MVNYNLAGRNLGDQVKRDCTIGHKPESLKNTKTRVEKAVRCPSKIDVRIVLMKPATGRVQ